MYMFEIELGPIGNKKTFRFDLPHSRKKIGVMVSGGLDSAALYYLIKKFNIDNNKQNEVIPIIIFREEGSKTHALNVVNYVNNIVNQISSSIKQFDFNKKVQPHLEVILATNLSIQQFDNLYIGVIQTRPEHAIGITVYRPTETDKLTYPFADLDKSHIVDLISKLHQTKLFGITISCDKGIDCKTCNGCRERAWGFETMKFKDYKI